MTSSQSSAKAEEELRAQLHQLQEETSARAERESRMAARVTELAAREEELEERLRWLQLEHSNQLEGRDARIAQLRRQLLAAEDAGRLQGECRRLYEETGQECRERMEAVTRRARTPSTKTVKEQLVRRQEEKGEEQGGRSTPSLMRPLPSPSSTRSKVFRHKLLQRGLKNAPVDKGEIVIVERRSTSHLPLDYRARVSTLPPILGMPTGASSSSKRLLDEDAARTLQTDQASLEVSVLANTSPSPSSPSPAEKKAEGWTAASTS